MNIDDLVFDHMFHIMDYLDRLRYYVNDIVDFEHKMNAHRNQRMRILLREEDFFHCVQVRKIRV